MPQLEVDRPPPMESDADPFNIPGNSFEGEEAVWAVELASAGEIEVKADRFKNFMLLRAHPIQEVLGGAAERAQGSRV